MHWATTTATSNLIRLSIGPASVATADAPQVEKPRPAPLSEPTNRTARDQLQAKRKQSALAQLSGKWEKR